ncbi:MAG: HAD family hydrolase [Lachnospiraceae bacterium]|nr:HAD family hydrolase [Lachnospiraceae bacterium]
MKKLIFFDIDGTIVTENGQKRVIPESTLDAIRKLRENGHLCFINSGRTMSEMNTMIYEIGMDGFVCGCGTYISYHDDILYSQTIPFNLGNEILKDLELCNLEWLLEGEKNLYYSTKPYETHIDDFRKEHMADDSLNYTLVEPEKAQYLTFDKFCVCLKKESDFKSFRKKYSQKLTFIDRGDDFWEIVPLGCSKASGMKYLMDYFKIPVEDTFAIGDSSNDLPMLEFAGTGIAMGNSSDIVFKHADYITDDILEDGIYNAMKHFKLI